MLPRLLIRLIHFWMLAMGRKPIKADVFITHKYNGQTQTFVLYKDWREVENLWNKLLSWESFVLAYGPKVQYNEFLHLKAGWRKIYYERG